MPGPRDLLQRFRFVGAPGAAAGGAVPADRMAEAAAELMPVLVVLDHAQEEARQIRADGLLTAERIRREAEEEAQRRVAAAEASAEELRAQVAAEVIRRATKERVAVQATAERKAQLVRDRVSSRMPAYVEQVVAAVIESIQEAEP